MQALSMIDMGTQVPEFQTPNKPSGTQDGAFNKVLKDQRSSEKTALKRSESREKSAEEKPVEKQGQEQQVETTEDVSAKTPDQAETKRDKVQHLLIDLLQTLVAGQNQQPQAGQEDMPTSPEALLSQLVQQLDSADSQGEQVLAGIDLTPLAEQLQQLSEADDGEDSQEQLVAQLAAALAVGTDLQTGMDAVVEHNDESGTEGNDGLAEIAAAMQMGQQIDAGSRDSLGKARRILQQAIDAVAGRQDVEQAAANSETELSEEQTEDAELLLDQQAEEIDPRFAGLLKPRQDDSKLQSLRERFQEQRSAQKPAEQESEVAQPLATAEVKSPQGKVEIADLLNADPKQGVENLSRQVQQQSPHAVGQQLDLNNIKQMPTETRMLQLPSGQQVAESQIFDQVVSHLNGSVNGESGRMVLRLHPAELGSLKLDLKVEGDKVSANLHAQSQQVQEVLQRHLPQLRNALAEQGLKIDQFQVNIDQHQGQQGQFENQAQQQRWNSRQQPVWRQDLAQEEQVVPLAHLMQNGGGGISLHV